MPAATWPGQLNGQYFLYARIDLQDGWFNFDIIFYFDLIRFGMNIEEIRDYALSLENVSESFPFGNDTIVFKVAGKIFLLASLTSEKLQFNVKCNPEYAIDLREEYPAILPGYHMNKKHWNTIISDGSLTANQLRGFINHSYLLVAGKGKSQAGKLTG